MERLSGATNDATTQGGWQQQAGSQQSGRQGNRQNVGDSERDVSFASGSVLALLGLSRRSLPGALIAAVGGGLIYRAVTGHCYAYDRLGINTAVERSPEEDLAKNGVDIGQSFIIHRPAAELYGFWRNFENLPRIMTHLESVRVLDDRRSHWVAKAQGLGGTRFEWDAELTDDVPNQRIAWRSLPDADVTNSGEVRFSPALGDRGTEVHVRMSYVPPAGRIGHWIASMLGQNPKRVVREDLRNFKRLIEIGEILTIIGQPHGTCTGQGELYTESEWKPLFT
jgi:uncharacterized membrane protein